MGSNSKQVQQPKRSPRQHKTCHTRNLLNSYTRTMSMVAFLPIVYEGKPPRFGEQPVNTRARGYSGTIFFKSTADDRYMPRELTGSN